MSEHELLQLIDDYLNGKLSGPMLQDFEQKMKKDASFKEEVLMHKEVNELMTVIEIEAVTEKARHLLKEEKKSTTTTIPITQTTKESTAKTIDINQGQNRFSWLKVAAILLLFLLPILYFVPSILQSPSSPQLAATYFEAPKDLVSVTRSTEAINQRQANWQKANQQYQQQNYAGALGILNEIPNSDTLALAKGLCYYMQDKAQQAIPYFQEIVQTPQSSFNTKASWYLAMSFLKSDQSDKAIPILQNLEKEKVGYHQEATQILKEIQ